MGVSGSRAQFDITDPAVLASLPSISVSMGDA